MRGISHVSQVQSSTKWCAADPGSSKTPNLCDPASAVHRHSAAKARVNALKALHRVRDTG